MAGALFKQGASVKIMLRDPLEDNALAFGLESRRTSFPEPVSLIYLQFSGPFVGNMVATGPWVEVFTVQGYSEAISHSMQQRQLGSVQISSHSLDLETDKREAIVFPKIIFPWEVKKCIYSTRPWKEENIEVQRKRKRKGGKEEGTKQKRKGTEE